MGKLPHWQCSWSLCDAVQSPIELSLRHMPPCSAMAGQTHVACRDKPARDAQGNMRRVENEKQQAQRLASYAHLEEQERREPWLQLQMGQQVRRLLRLFMHGASLSMLRTADCESCAGSASAWQPLLHAMRAASFLVMFVWPCMHLIQLLHGATSQEGALMLMLVLAGWNRVDPANHRRLVPSQQICGMPPLD